MASRNRTVFLALAVAVLALVLLFVWIPLDIDSGVVERVRRRNTIGDSMAPVLAGVIILLGALILLLERKREVTVGLTRENLRFLVALIALGAISFGLMRWAGPAIMALAAFEYRPLRADIPWKYIGFVSGGWVMVFGLITLAERRMSARAALVALGTVCVLIAVYDLPFDHLLLPPNGDL